MTNERSQDEPREVDASGSSHCSDADDRACVICGTVLTCAVNDWSTYQPYMGGEIRLVFSYGSCKFDNHMAETEFRGIICDDCGSELVPKMDYVGDQ